VSRVAKGKQIQLQSNLGSQTPQIMNNSVYEQIFRTQSISDDVLCLELRTLKHRKKKKNPLPNNNVSLPHHLPLTPSTLLLTTFHLCRQLSSSPPSTYAVNSPHHLPLMPSTPPHHLPLTPSTLLHTSTVKLN